MVAEPLPERYAPYIQELQEFFALHDLSFGSPNDLAKLSEHLSGPGAFPSEISSMARSFIFRERGALPGAELFQIVAVAAGGPAIDDPPQHLQQPLHRLGEFLTAIAKAPLDQPTPAPAVETDPPSIASPPTEPVYAAMPNSRNGSYRPLKRTSTRGDWTFRACVGILLIVLAYFFIHQFTEPSLPSTRAREATAQSTPAGISSPMAAVTQTIADTLLPSSAVQNPPSDLNSPTSFASAPASIVSRGSLQRQPSAAPSQPNASQAPPPPSASTHRAPTQPPLTSPSASLNSAPATSRQAPPRTTRTPIAAISAPQVFLGASSGVMSGHLLSAPRPAYPKFASFTHVEGQVVLQAVVARDGRVSVVRVLQGHHLLRGAAANAVRTWRYRPYLANGRPVDVATIITMDFKLPH